MSFATRIASLGGTCGLATALALLASAPAFAQAQKPAAQPAKPAAQGQAAQPQQQSGPTVVQVKAEPSQPEWTKVCGKDQNANAEICYTTRDFVSDQGQPVLALAVYDVKGQQPQKVVRFVMPLGLLLQPGLRFAVDQGQATAGRYVMCLPNGCFAEAQVKDDFIASLKKGANLNVSVQNQVGREITFAVPAAGFAKAFDGPPIDPKVLEEQQKKLQEELQKKSEEMRQKMLQSSGAAGQGGQPAAPQAPKQ
ncbi:MAG TPA: invasion associated locus B family protein [Microvirga sp.]|nr:invasion associated locus B family protein [Microvirga sp.]